MPNLVTPSESLPRSSPTVRYWRPRLATSLILLGCLLGIGYTVAERKLPTGAANGSELPGRALSPAKSRQTSRRIRVATFNIHGGCGLDGRIDLTRTAATLDRDLDFVGMNEVHGGNWTDPRCQAEQLGSQLNMNWLFAPTEATGFGSHFGQGVLSRLPVTYWRRVPFGRVSGNGYRNYVECQVSLGAHNSATHLTILVTHLDRRSDRQDQLRVVIQRFLEVPTPAILMGDLNSKRTEPQLIELTKKPGVVDCFGQFATGELSWTRPSTRPLKPLIPQAAVSFVAVQGIVRRRIDWIFSRGLNCVTSNLESTDASDHPWGWAEFELPGLAQAQ